MQQKLARQKLDSKYANSLEANRIKFLKTLQICLTIPPLDSQTLTNTDKVLKLLLSHVLLEKAIRRHLLYSNIIHS